MDTRVTNGVVRLFLAVAWLPCSMACNGDSRQRESDANDETGIVTVTAGLETTSTGTDGSTSTDTSTDSSGVVTGDCAAFDGEVERVVPTLVLLVDQSSSMIIDFEGEPRWDAVYATLMDPNEGVVARLESTVRFGLTLYSSDNGYDGGSCPMLTSVPPALDNRDAIDAVYAQAEPIDETPTGESLDAVARDLSAIDEDGPKIIVLATDGEPDTCSVPNPQNGQERSLVAAETAFEFGIRTFIISVGQEVGEQHLQQMANVGVGRERSADDPARFYQARNEDELVSAFDAILSSFVDCTFALEGEVDLERACEGTVILDGRELVCGEEWQLTDASTLELIGGACGALQVGENHDLDASWTCDAVVIP